MSVGNMLNRDDKFYYTVSLAADSASDPVIITGQGHRPGFVMVAVAPTGGAAGKAQYSCTDPATIRASGTITWHDWLSGSVASGSEKYAIEGRAMTAIRFVQTGAGALVGEISF